MLGYATFSHLISLNLSLKLSEVTKIGKIVFPAYTLDDKTQYLFNPRCRFIIDGYEFDDWLNWKKIVDTYRGWGAHGSDALSSKDSSKVDTSRDYIGRLIDKY